MNKFGNYVLTESYSLHSIKYSNELKQWIYPMFFSTRAGPHRIKIVNSVNVESKKFVQYPMNYICHMIM